jgi:splicing factor 3B subunit 3
LVPLTSKEDVTFFTHLESSLRRENPTNLCQRDHMSFRSFYQPVRHTLDGDLCERFGMLSPAKQTELAQGVGRTPAEVQKKLEEQRFILL